MLIWSNAAANTPSEREEEQIDAAMEEETDKSSAIRLFKISIQAGLRGLSYLCQLINPYTTVGFEIN